MVIVVGMVLIGEVVSPMCGWEAPSVVDRVGRYVTGGEGNLCNLSDGAGRCSMLEETCYHMTVDLVAVEDSVLCTVVVKKDHVNSLVEDSDVSAVHSVLSKRWGALFVIWLE